LNERMPDDVLKLARSIYENYLHVVFVGSHPTNLYDLVDAKLGLRGGTHRYKTKKDGSDDKRHIVDIRTGLEYLGHIPAYRMAESSELVEDQLFFDFFYSRTSEFLHPSAATLDGYVSKDGLDPLKPHMYEEGVIFSACVACMVADRISSMSGCPSQLANDAETVVKRVKSILLELLEQLDIWQQRFGTESGDVSLLQRRCKRLAER
jgi:hypothetical protein